MRTTLPHGPVCVHPEMAAGSTGITLWGDDVPENPSLVQFSLSRTQLGEWGC